MDRLKQKLPGDGADNCKLRRDSVQNRIPDTVRTSVVSDWRLGIRIWEIARKHDISERSVHRIVNESA